MGCSSSSAQTVDQEKRPGTKPEESNGDTVAVRSVIDTEDAQTIKDQMQLPVQTALPEVLQPGGDDEAEAVLVALEAQEVFSSGVGLLPDLEPQLVPVTATADSAPEAAAPAEATTETEAAITLVDDLPVVEQLAPVENVVAEATPEVKALVKATEEAPSDESIVATQADAYAVVEEMTAVTAKASPEVAAPALEPVISEPTEAAVVEEEAAALGTEAPVKVADVEAEAPTYNVAPDSASTALCESSEPNEAAAPALSDVSAVGESSAPGEGVVLDEVSAPSEAPLQVEEPVIDTKIAVATIPEMPPLSPVTLKAQDEPQPFVKDATITPLAPDNTAPTAEAPCHNEAIPAPAPENESAVAEMVQGEEIPASTLADSETPSDVPAATVTSEPVVASVAPAGSPVVVSTLPDSSAPLAPAPGLSLKVVSATEALQDIEREKSKKED
uniref:calphotin-like n=1 Tax=Semicossyphus pulcher TaxID=241346 RepID=UPI0037E970DF